MITPVCRCCDWDKKFCREIYPAAADGVKKIGRKSSRFASHEKLIAVAGSGIGKLVPAALTVSRPAAWRKDFPSPDSWFPSRPLPFNPSRHRLKGKVFFSESIFYVAALDLEGRNRESPAILPSPITRSGRRIRSRSS
ncbi:hypothetical protein KSP40_PGU014558 [Platanthera guangdongensis]|uniref:Uncharacterized protein n=1 Tax=Platanthera guangdongensis TaxID=2320717 RepID=A0ABR2M4L4_9ASPA